MVRCEKNEKLSSSNTTSPLIVFAMLPHEQKMSVLNFVVRRTPGNDEIIQSKERLIFHCGYRRFAACPIFSQVFFFKSFPYHVMT